MEYFAGTFRRKGYITILPQIRALFCWYLLLFWNSLRPTMNYHITSCFIYFTLPMYKLLINCFAKWFCVTVLLLDCIVFFFLVLVYCFSWPILFCHCYFLVTLMLELWWRWNILANTDVELVLMKHDVFSLTKHIVYGDPHTLHLLSLSM